MILKVWLPELHLGVLFEPRRYSPSRKKGLGAISLGLWLPIGSRFESNSEYGLSHLVEHLVFKKKTVARFLDMLEGKGADLNGFTSHEYTCYQVMCLNEDAGLALSFLSEILKDLEVTLQDFQREKHVIIQEILSAKDDVEHEFHEFVMKRAFPQTGLDRSIAGDIEDVERLSYQDAKGYHHRFYQSGKIILSVAGEFDPSSIKLLIHQKFKFRKKIKKSIEAKETLGYFPPIIMNEQVKKLKPGVYVHERNTQHLYLSVLFELESIYSCDRFLANLIHAWFAQGMTSRLFQRLREELGLVYFVNGNIASFLDRGFYLIEASSDSDKMPEVLEVLFNELVQLKSQVFPPKWLRKYKSLIRGQTLLASYDFENRMSSLAIQELYFKKPASIFNYLINYQKITAQDLRRFVKERLDPQQAGIFFYGSQASKFPPFVSHLMTQIASHKNS